MPSEVIIPGFTATILLLMITLSITGVITTSLSFTVNTLREAYESYRKRLNRVLISWASLEYDGGMLRGEILVYNDGSQPVYRFNTCDLIIEYYSASGVFRSLRLNYPVEWLVERVYLVEDYSVEFAEHPSIGQGEAGLIRVSITVSDIDVSKPVRIVFTTDLGASATKWVLINVES
ncbi:MAG: hypothetical protein QXP68_06740 [Thermosphaera sp.]